MYIVAECSHCALYNVPLTRCLVINLLLLLLLLLLLHTIAVQLLLQLLLLAQVPFLRLPLSYFCLCHVVANLAASVVAKHAETSLYPAFTDPPDDTEILQIIQILQIVQIASRLRCADHPDHTYST